MLYDGDQMKDTTKTTIQPDCSKCKWVCIEGCRLRFPNCDFELDELEAHLNEIREA